MDASIIRDEARMAMLQYGLQDMRVQSRFNLTVRDIVLLRILKPILPALTLEELRDAIASDKTFFESSTYKFPLMVDRHESTGGYTFDSRKIHPKDFNASREDYEELIAGWLAKPRPPIAAFEVSRLLLTPAPETVALKNVGFGGPDALCVTQHGCPDWLEVTRAGLEFTLKAKPAHPGVYDGRFFVETNGGTAEITVEVERLDFKIPNADEVSLSELLPDDPNIDAVRTRDKLREKLAALKYTELPGGIFVEPQERQPFPDVIEVKLRPEYVKSGVVPVGFALPEHPSLLDADGTEWTAQPAPAYSDGFLMNLEDLFEDYEIDPKAQGYLLLKPVPNGFQFEFAPANPLKELSAYRYWLTGAAAKLAALPDLPSYLGRWLEAAEVNVIVSAWQDNEFTRLLADLHRAGRLSLRTTSSALEPWVTAEGDSWQTINLETRKPVKNSLSMGFLWRRAVIFEGVDVREQGYAGGEGKDLPFTPNQRLIAAALERGTLPELDTPTLLEEYGVAPRKGPLPKGIEAEDKEDAWFRTSGLYTSLVKLKADFKRVTGHKDGDQRLASAKALLKRHSVSGEQVNLWGVLWVTKGGWMGPNPEAMSLRDLAKLAVSVIDEPLHHSQLRKLAEAYLGKSIDHYAFMQASLYACGWAGDGYRRQRIVGEPDGRNLEAVVRDVLRRKFLSRTALIRTTLQYVRTPPEKIGEVYDRVMHEYWEGGES